jgi:hypothetical protein
MRPGRSVSVLNDTDTSDIVNDPVVSSAPPEGVGTTSA